MKSIVKNVVQADEMRDRYIQEQLQSMFRQYGPDSLSEESEISVVDFGAPAENPELQKRLAACIENPALARNGKFSPLHGVRGPIDNKQGLYVVLTDYRPSSLDVDACTFKIDGLTAIYRGEAFKVRERVLGHLFQSIYQPSMLATQIPWPGFMTIDAKNGIDIHSEDYAKSRWMVVVYQLPGCGSHIRKKAEVAFDAVFGKPAASTR